MLCMQFLCPVNVILAFIDYLKEHTTNRYFA
jgi:hypothetical protein